jgi:hypothetical protein
MNLQELAAEEKAQEIKHFLDNELHDFNTGWVASHHALRHYDNISYLARLVLLDIITLSKHYGFCFASNEHFAKLYKTSTSSIKRTMRELQSEDFIERTCERKGHNRFPRIIHLNCEKIKEMISTEMGSNMTPIGVTDDLIIRKYNNSGGYHIEVTKSNSQIIKYEGVKTDPIADEDNCETTNDDGATDDTLTDDENYAPKFDEVKTQFSEQTSKNQIKARLQEILIDDEELGTNYGKN